MARRTDRLDGLGVTETLTADLTAAEGVSAVWERLRDPKLPIDLLVNCAGIGSSGPFVDGDIEEFRKVIDLNITALVELSHAAAEPMAARGRGWIMNISSLGGHAPGPGFAVYSATKAFVTSFSESLHEELGPRGVVVTAVCPGATHTEFGAGAGANGDDLPEFLWQSADQVAAEAIAATAAGRAVRVTGIPNRVTAVASAALPRTVRRKMAGAIASRL